jgi:hypothetical protein
MAKTAQPVKSEKKATTKKLEKKNPLPGVKPLMYLS